MSLPQVIIDVGFTSPYVDDDAFIVGDPVRGVVGANEVTGDVWTDITPWVRHWSVREGAGRADTPTLRYEAGTATIVLNDGDRRFDAANLAGPYVSGDVSLIQPMVRVRIRAVWRGITYPVYYGFADDWQPDYQGNDWTYTTLTATDASKIFADIDRSPIAPAGEGEMAGVRVGRILDDADWPAEDREIAVGDTDLQATDLGGNALAELQLVQDTELGEFYFDRRGYARFRNRQAMITYARSTTPQAVFGDAGWPGTNEWTFEDGLVPFTPTNSTVEPDQVFVDSGQYSMLLTVVGSPASAYARQDDAWPVTPGYRYRVIMRAMRPVAGNVVGAADWYFAAGMLDYISTNSTTVAVDAGVWTTVEFTATAPVNAVYARPGPTLSGSPADGTQVYVDSIQMFGLDDELPYADVKPSTGDEGLANHIQISRAGGTEQVVEDALSISKYLKKTHTRNDLLMRTDADALAYANALLYQWARRVYRFARIEFNTPAPQYEDAIWPQLLGRLFGDRITVRRRPAGGGDPIERDCFIRGLEFESDGAFWRSAWVLQDASRYSFFVVGDPILGVVGENAIAY